MNALLLIGKNDHAYDFVAQWGDKVGHHWRAATNPVTHTEVVGWNPDVIVSYSYRHIVVPDVLAIPRLGCWNLHPSLLPIGRGAHPIFWALAEGQTVGVSVHEMNAGLDTGPMLGWTALTPKASDTLRTLYDHAHEVLRAVFWAHWPKISHDVARERTIPQAGVSTYHRAAHLEPYWPKLPDGWDTPIHVVQGLGLDHATAHA